MDLYEENFEQEYKREQAGKKAAKGLGIAVIGGACLLFAHVALRLNHHQACKVTDSGPDDPLHPSVGADKAGEIRVQERGRRQRRRSVLV